MLAMVRQLLRRMFSHFRRPPSHRRAAKPKVTVRRFGTHSSWKLKPKKPNQNQQATSLEIPPKPIRIATFNAAMFSMAPAVSSLSSSSSQHDIRCKMANDVIRRRPKGILKQQQQHKSLSRSVTEKLRVSINLPDNEISLQKTNQKGKGKAVMGHSLSFSGCVVAGGGAGGVHHDDMQQVMRRRSVLEVLKEVDADIIGLQNVRAEEEKAMKPLSELAEGLGMRYVFAESWAPEYGNAVLSKWPIKRWKALRIFDDTDFRNVLKATIEVPQIGEVNFHCTHLDHLDENWRMKQVNAILRSSDGPHILAGGLNSLDETDYSAERWADIVKYYEQIGKPTPKVEVMKYLKARQYVDAKDYAGECESVVVVAKGQDVQGTCKYGTRLDYILASANSPYKFVPGSYGVISSKGTSDHHIVKVDITIAKIDENELARGHPRQRVVKMGNASTKGIWGPK